MSLDKAIQHGKERRKSYEERGKPGRFDPTCRPHGGGRRTMPCPWCERARLWHAYRELAEAEEQLRTLDEMLDEERRLRHGEPQDWKQAVIDAYSQSGDLAKAREDSREIDAAPRGADPGQGRTPANRR